MRCQARAFENSKVNEYTAHLRNSAVWGAQRHRSMPGRCLSCLGEGLHPLHMSSGETCLCTRGDGCALGRQGRELNQSKVVITCLRRHRCLHVVIFS